MFGQEARKGKEVKQASCMVSCHSLHELSYLADEEWVQVNHVNLFKK